LAKRDHYDFSLDFSVCTALAVGVHHLISWLDGTVMSIGLTSSSRAHSQIFQSSHRPLCHISVHVTVILVMID